MKWYSKKNPSWFNVTAKELEEAKTNKKFDLRYYYENLARVKNALGSDIVAFELKDLPEKRNAHDYACLIVIERACGKLEARRFNNSHNLSLRW